MGLLGFPLFPPSKMLGIHSAPAQALDSHFMFRYQDPPGNAMDIPPLPWLLKVVAFLGFSKLRVGPAGSLPFARHVAGLSLRIICKKPTQLPFQGLSSDILSTQNLYCY